MNPARYILLNYAIRQNAINAIESLDTDSLYEVVIKPHKKQRSLAQNSLFHAWCNEISERYAEHYGERRAPWVWKQFLKEEFLGFDSDMLRGKLVIETKHTSDLKVGEFAEFLNKIEVWCVTELGFDLSRNEWYDEAIGRRNAA